MEMWYRNCKKIIKSSEDIMNLIETGKSDEFDEIEKNIYGKNYSLIKQLEANNIEILKAAYDPNLPKDMTVKEFRIKHKDLFDEHERLENLLKENRNGTK